MNKEKEIAMVIESLSSRIEECVTESCAEHRKTFHCNMMRLEARHLLELLGEEEKKLDQEELRRNVKGFAKAASTMFDTLRAEIKIAEELYKKSRKKKGASWN